MVGSLSFADYSLLLFRILIFVSCCFSLNFWLSLFPSLFSNPRSLLFTASHPSFSSLYFTTQPGGEGKGLSHFALFLYIEVKHDAQLTKCDTHIWCYEDGQSIRWGRQTAKHNANLVRFYELKQHKKRPHFFVFISFCVENGLIRCMNICKEYTMKNVS